MLALPDGLTEEIEAAWVVGADGAHSTVRKELGLGFEGSKLPINFAITDAELCPTPDPDATPMAPASPPAGATQRAVLRGVTLPSAGSACCAGG